MLPEKGDAVLMVADNELYDKLRGQRMLLTKWIKRYNETDDDGEKQRAAHKLADVLAWAKSVGMSPSEIAEDRRQLPNQALELFESGAGTDRPADKAELNEAETEVRSSVDTTGVQRLGEGSGSVYVYGYECAPDRLKIGKTNGDVVSRIAGQMNESTPDRPILYLIFATSNPGALERALQGVLVLRGQWVQPCGGKEWYRTTVTEVLAIYHALLGHTLQY
jgi:hypothetical protein